MNYDDNTLSECNKIINELIARVQHELLSNRYCTRSITACRCSKTCGPTNPDNIKHSVLMYGDKDSGCITLFHIDP